MFYFVALSVTNNNYYFFTTTYSMPLSLLAILALFFMNTSVFLIKSFLRLNLTFSHLVI